MHTKPSRIRRGVTVASALLLTAGFAFGTIVSGQGPFSEKDGLTTAQAALPNVVVSPEPANLTPKALAPLTAGNSAFTTPTQQQRHPKTATEGGGELHVMDARQQLSSTRDTKKRERRYRFGYPMVAMGDSTMALAPTTKRTNPFGTCSHYKGTWPLQLSERLRLPLADLSCAGAKTSSYWAKNLVKYVGPATRLVVLTYGSNDIRVVYQLIQDNALPGTGPRLPGKTTREVETSLVKILRDVRKRAPNAMILTVGYLPLVQQTQCSNLPNMTPIEMSRIRRLRENADAALSAATRRAGRVSESQWLNRGVQFITSGMYNVPFRQVRGHDLCASDTQRFVLNHEKKGVRYHYTKPGVDFVANSVLQKYWAEQRLWERQIRNFGG